MSDITLTHNRDAHRYEAWQDDTLAGFADYQLTDGLIVFPHTEVDPALEGQGIGSKIAKFALDDVRADGTRSVVPQCPFIRVWIERHPEYSDLVDGSSTSTAKD